MKRQAFLKTIFAFAVPFSIIAFSASCKTATKGTCQESKRSKFCPQEYKPVCGCNNKTYNNACESEAYGIKKYTEGVCK